MKRKTKKRQNRKLSLEKLIFASALALIGLFVISLFSAMLLQKSGLNFENSSLRTQVMQGENFEITTSQSPNKGAAESLLIVGAFSFCILGCAIFAGIKIHERFF